MSSTPSSPSTNKRKRKNYELSLVQEIIDKYNSGMKPKQLAIMFDMPASTISCMVSKKKQEKVEKALNNLTTPSSKRIRQSNYPEIEKNLNDWFGDCKSKQSVTIDGPSMQNQALKIAAMLNNDKFKASKGWLQKFNKRHHISLQRNNGEAGLVDMVAAKNYLDNVLPGLVSDYHPDNIFNADETALFYKAMPTKSYQYKNKKNDDIKICKERVSLLLCCSLTGEKLKPVFIGKSSNPRCMKNINKANLPVYYRSNASAWMTSEIFIDWLDKLNRQMSANDRKIVLFLDNFSGHALRPAGYSHINVQFFPANMTSVIQPLDMGIIHAFKAKYRSQIVRAKLDSIEYNSSMPLIDIMNAIQMCKVAWDSVTAETIKNCFKKAGFDFKFVPVIEAEDEVEVSDEVEYNYQEFMQSCYELLAKSNEIDKFDISEYYGIDSELPAREAYCEENIIKQISATAEPISDDEESAIPLRPPISKKQALENITELKDYFKGMI